MDAKYLVRDDVARMIRLAIRRGRKMFDAYQDMDDESLFADLYGEVARSNYKPEKMQPHSFAYMCAYARMKDISRKRSKERQRREEAIGLGEFKRDTCTDDDTLEEILVRLYERAGRELEGYGYAPRHKYGQVTGRTRQQRLALHLLHSLKGWSCREIEKRLADNPGALRAIGVENAPTYKFFQHVSESGTDLQKIIGCFSAKGHAA